MRSLLAQLPEVHRHALGWFLEHSRTVTGWPGSIEVSGKLVHLATAAKGIYKPDWSKYALSVRQGSGGEYPDQPPVFKPDGSWVYAYYQENRDPAKRDQFFTNRALLECMAQRVPVGVFRKVGNKPRPRYEILGIAMVNNWDGGFFYLEGFNKERRARPRGPEAEWDFLRGILEQRKRDVGIPDPATIQDARKWVMASIVQREGQREFRDVLLDAYGYKCAVTGYDAPRALEAAHIIPYQGPRTNEAGNGLLLRADLHTLFDVGMIAVDPNRMAILVNDELKRSEYRHFEGCGLSIPHEEAMRPSVLLLKAHREWAGL